MIVNLDPGNDVLPFECAVDVMELIKLEDVMRDLGLGPNGGLVYCMEYLEQNLDWLKDKLDDKCKGVASNHFSSCSELAGAKPLPPTSPPLAPLTEMHTTTRRAACDLTSLLQRCALTSHRGPPPRQIHTVRLPWAN